VGTNKLVMSYCKPCIPVSLFGLPLYYDVTSVDVIEDAACGLGSKWLDNNHLNLGFIHHCFICGYRSYKRKSSEFCPECNSILKNAGPLWIGKIYDKDFIENIIKEFEDGKNKPIIKIAETANQEIDLPPTYYTLDNLSSELKVVTPSLDRVISSLKDIGFLASRTTLNPIGIKTDASHSVMLRLVKDLS